MYGRLGASVVVNDMSKANADAVVAEIIKGESSFMIDSR
jgi:hypothetical protein